MGSLLLRAITTLRIALPFAAALLVGFLYWGVTSSRLARQIDAAEPTPMSFLQAVAASRDHEVFVRFDDATIDCTKGIRTRLGDVFALVDRDGRVAAMIRLDGCRAAGPALQGVFLDPPYGLYGEAVARGYDVTPGHLAFFDPRADSSGAWSRVGLSVFMAIMAVALAGSIALAHRTPSRKRAWRVRGLGFALLAVLPWFTYVTRDYFFVRVVPAWVVAAVAMVIAAAFVIAPERPYIVKVTRKWFDERGDG